MSKTEFVIVMIMTVIVILAWVVTGIIRVRPSVEVDSKITELLEPIDPSFDEEALKLLKTPPTPLPLISPVPRTPAPSVAPSSSPVASGSAIPLPRSSLPPATSSGTPSASVTGI